VLLALVPSLLLAGCAPKDSDAGQQDADDNEVILSPSGPLRMKNHAGAWVDFELDRKVTLDEDTPARLSFWGHSDPIPSAVDDEADLTLSLHVAPAVLGTGPVTLTLDGSVTVPPSRTEPITFTPGPHHSAELLAAYASLSLNCAAPEDAVLQTVSGTLVLTENSATHLRGRLDLTTQGSTAGCPGGDTEAHLDFDVRR